MNQMIKVLIKRLSAYLVAVVALLFTAPHSHAVAGECVRVYYDAIDGDAKMTYFGRVHAMYLDNILGHFPSLQTILSPVSKYKAGDIESCKASIYLGTYYDAPVPEAFIKDVVSTKKHIAWAGYNIWKLGDKNLADIFGVKFTGLTALDKDKRDEKGRPGFYRFYSYRGEEFEKYGEWDVKDAQRFNAAFEIGKFEIIDPTYQGNVLSWARHTNAAYPEIPYALHDAKGSRNHWYFGDSPFSFMVESDRYLIFADLLFDILGETPRRTSGPKPALFRVEDVHAMVPMWQLFNMVDVLKKHSVPFSMTMIPIFTDPFGHVIDDPANRFVPVTRDGTFREFINYSRDAGATFIYHGVTHQYGQHLNPFNGMSGDDFEFWDRVNNTAIEKDNVPFVQSRLEDGLQLFELAGIRPVAWLSPHYQASPLCYNLFGQLFTWNAGRATYFPYIKSQAMPVPESLTMDRVASSGRGERARYTADLSVKYDASQLPNGQFYPYEIFGDSYGQRIIPENVGNVQSFMNEQVFKVLTVDGMIANMKRNRVLRDSWASFFIHPFTLESHANEGLGAFPGDVREVERLIAATREYGYEFIDLSAWIRDNTLPKRPVTIEIQP